jgi:Domain of unknown function (DUF1918)
MQLKAGARVEVESESTERPPRMGVIEEVLREAPSPRYRIRWGRRTREHLHTGSGGAAHGQAGRTRLGRTAGGDHAALVPEPNRLAGTRALGAARAARPVVESRSGSSRELPS